LKIHSKDSQVWNKKGVALEEQGEFQEAIKCYNKSLKIDPMDGESME